MFFQIIQPVQTLEFSGSLQIGYFGIYSRNYINKTCKKKQT